MKQSNAFFIVIMLIFNVILAVVAFVNFFDISVPLINPVISNPYHETFNLIYPPQPPGTLSTDTLICSVEVSISSPTPLVANRPVNITAVGSGFPSRIENISAVMVGFPGAEPFVNNGSVIVGGGPFGGVVLTPQKYVENPPPIGFFFGEYLLGYGEQIQFPIPQAYTLMMTISFTNSTTITQVFYPNDAVYVNPTDYLSQPRQTRFDYAVGIMSVVDILSAVSKVAYDHWKEQQSQIQRPVSARKRTKRRPQSDRQPKNKITVLYYSRYSQEEYR